MLENDLKNIFEIANINSPWLSFSGDLGKITGLYPPRLYPKDTQLYGCNEYSPNVYVVVSGQVENFSVDVDGHKKVLMIGGRGIFMGDISAIDGRPNYTGARTREDSRISSIPKHNFLPLILADRDLSLMILREMSEKIRSLNSQVELSWYKDSVSKVAYVVLSMCRDAKPDANGFCTVKFRLTQSEIAQITGLNRVTVTKTIGAFLREGVLLKRRERQYAVHVGRLRERINLLSCL